MSLAFIRVPKTGSTVIASQIQALNDPCLTDRHVTAAEFAAHGHPHEFITLARDPLQMQCSAYYYLKPRVRQPDLPPAAYKYDPLTIQMLQNNCTLDEFLTEHPGDQFMAKYWAGEDPRNFLWVGLQTAMGESLGILESLTGLALENRYINMGTHSGVYVVPDAVEQVFRARNQGEYEMYAKAVEKFETLSR